MPKWLVRVRWARPGRLAAVALLTAAGLSMGGVAQANPARARTLVVGVDHVDPANQQPQFGRLFEYTDFFSRDVTVRRGDTVDFLTAPGSFHIVALASSERAALAAYPLAFPDSDDPNAPNGAPKVALGPSNFPITGGSTAGGGQIAFDRPNGPPVCGVPALGEAPCTFAGGNDVEVAGPNPGFDAQGNPAPADWDVHVTAQPGTYRFFCVIHPGMRGTLHVVGTNQPASTQRQVDAAGARQFRQDRHQALVAEQAANHVTFHGGQPGHRTYDVRVGIGAADRHVAIDEMLPAAPLHLAVGDRVRYLWLDPHNVHTVFFPASGDIGPFGFDCGATYQSGEEPGPPCTEPGEGVEAIADPGNAASGTVLTSPDTVVDSGVLLGRGYHVPSTQRWSVATAAGTTATGTYSYHCTVHDFMAGTLVVS